VAVLASTNELVDGNPSQPVAMLICFGLVHSLRGFSNFIKLELWRSKLISIAYILATSAYFYAYPHLPELILFGYALVTIYAVVLTSPGLVSRLKLHFKVIPAPDLIFPLVSFSAAYFAPTWQVAFGFIAWGLGYVSMYFMRRK